MNWPDLHSTGVILGLTVVTVIARSFFLISSRPWTLPPWAHRALQYAPIAALSAVVVPEVLLTQGSWSGHWLDARPFAAVAGALAFYWRRDVLFTIVVGMAVYLPLHIGLGW